MKPALPGGGGGLVALMEIGYHSHPSYSAGCPANPLVQERRKRLQIATGFSVGSAVCEGLAETPGLRFAPALAGCGCTGVAG